MLYPLELEFIGSCELPDMGTDLRSFARALNDWPSPQPIREVFVFVFVFCFLFCFVLFFLELRTEPRALCLLGKCSTTELKPQPLGSFY